MLNKIILPAVILTIALMGYQFMNAEEAPRSTRQQPAESTRSEAPKTEQTANPSRENQERPAGENSEQTQTAAQQATAQQPANSRTQRGGGNGMRSGVLASQGATAVEVMRSTLYTGSAQLKVFGVIDAQEKTIITAQSNATVAKLLVKEGDQITAQQPIAQLVDANISAALTQKEASLRELEARLRNEALKHENDKASLAIEKELLAIAKNSLDRFTNLNAQQLGSSTDYETALKAYQAQLLSVQNRELTIAQYADTVAQSNAQRSSLMSQIEQSQRQVDALTPTSDFSGIVAKLPINQGQILKTGETIAELYNPNSIAVYVRIPQRYRLDQFELSLITAVDSDGQTWQAQAIRPVSESGAQRITFIPESPLASAPLPGTHIALTVFYPITDSAVEVPITAVYDQQRLYLFQRGTIAPVEIELLGQTDQGFLISAPELLNDSTMIVTTRLNNPVTGMAVSLVRQGGGRP